MPLTPADVRSVVFSKSPMGQRGFHEDEVDAFLDLVEAELTRLITENEELHSRLERLERHQDVTAGPAESALGPPQPCCSVVASLPPIVDQGAPEGDHNVHVARVLGLAQQMADRLTSQAQDQADAILNQARAQTEQLLGDAKAKAEDLILEAKARTEVMLTDVRAKAETLERQSQEKTALLEREAARRHNEAIAVFDQEKIALEYKIDRLRALERDYRTRLKNYFTAQLYELDPDETAPPPAPLPNLQSPPAAKSNTYAETGSR